MFKIKLKEAREKAGYTQKQLSILIGKSNGVVGNWEAGSREPDLETINKIANVLNIKVSDLVDNTTDNPAPPQKEKLATIISNELTDRELEYIKLYRAASPELQAAALAMLEAAEKVRLARDSSAIDK